MTDLATPWVTAPDGEPAPDGRPRLFCLPHAGGDTGTYQPWCRRLAQEAEVLPVVLPGRGKRYQEPPVTRMTELVGALADGLAPLTGAPYAFFGHSLGAVVAFETARELTRRGRPPALLIASASPAPRGAAEAARGRHLLPDDEFLDAVLATGGTPAEALEEPELLRIVLPRLRADYTLAETYRWSGEGPALPCPVRVYAGRDDDTLRGARLDEWSRVSTRDPVAPRTFPGGHFYLEQARQDVLAAVGADLAAAVRAGRHDVGGARGPGGRGGERGEGRGEGRCAHT